MWWSQCFHVYPWWQAFPVHTPHGGFTAHLFQKAYLCQKHLGAKCSTLGSYQAGTVLLRPTDSHLDQVWAPL